jgi:hypothetical protein
MGSDHLYEEYVGKLIDQDSRTGFIRFGLRAHEVHQYIQPGRIDGIFAPDVQHIRQCIEDRVGQRAFEFEITADEFLGWPLGSWLASLARCIQQLIFPFLARSNNSPATGS